MAILALAAAPVAPTQTASRCMGCINLPSTVNLSHRISVPNGVILRDVLLKIQRKHDLDESESTQTSHKTGDSSIFLQHAYHLYSNVCSLLGSLSPQHSSTSVCSLFNRKILHFCIFLFDSCLPSRSSVVLSASSLSGRC